MAQQRQAVREREAGPGELTLDERARILEREVTKRQREGWLLVDRTTTTAQLQKQVQLFPTWAVVLLTIVTLGLIWLVLLAFKKSATMFIEVDEAGHVHTRVHG